MLSSCRIFEQFAVLLDPVTEFKKLRSAHQKQGTIMVPKQADPLFSYRQSIFSNPDPATLIQIHATLVPYQHVK